MERRSFIGSGAALLGGSLLSSCGGNRGSVEMGRAPSPSSPSLSSTYNANLPLRLSFQEGVVPGDSLESKLTFMEGLGVEGLEVGGGSLIDRVSEIKSALVGRNIKVSAICAGFSGFILSEDESVRRSCIDTMRAIIECAGALGAVGVIMVPVFNSQQPSKPHTASTRDFLCHELYDLGSYAITYGTTVILEPLNRGESFYLRQVADAASICRDVGNGGVCCMGDFWHMTAEETSDMGAFISGGSQLRHVHIASRRRRVIPGEDGDTDDYTEGFRGLKMLGYGGYVSFECGCAGADRGSLLTSAVELLRSQWSAA
jgi:sugar phosphate isomerase/epimerase